MPVYEFFWYDENCEHVAEHDVSMDDFERIVCNPLRVEKSRSSDRFVAYGYSTDGRKLVCIYERIDDETILPITGYEVQ